MSELNIYQNRSNPTEPMLNVSVEWSTQITENRAGKENRIPKITEPQYTIEGSDFALRDDDYDVFVNAFLVAEGKNNAFPFKCPLDYYCTADTERYGVGFQRGLLVQIDELNYQIVKQYSSGGVSTYKTILFPVGGTIQVYEDDIEVFPTVNLSTGTVTFDIAPIGTLKIECEFRLPMRFDVDDNQLNQIKRAVNSIYTANDTSIYLAVNFRLVEDMNYVRQSPLGDWTSNVSLDFDGNPLSDVAYSERSLTRIQSSDNKRELRDGLGVFRKKFAIANNNMNWNDTQKYYTLFMACKGRLLPFTFEGSLVRLDSDIFNVSMIGYNNVFINQAEYIIDAETYIITFIDTTSLTAPEISNINAAIVELRALLAADVYGSTELANKYVKPPINKSDERYMIWPASDYRDNSSEPKKYLFLAFVDETNRVFDSSPESTSNSYHYIPRNVSVEPTNLWTADFNTFADVYPDFAIFNYLIFSPTGAPPTPAETAFNPHIIDVVAGSNGYPAMSAYNFTAKPFWNENATGQETYDAIIDFIS